jgi:hypothetical protein
MLSFKVDALLNFRTKSLDPTQKVPTAVWHRIKTTWLNLPRDVKEMERITRTTNNTVATDGGNYIVAVSAN